VQRAFSLTTGVGNTGVGWYSLFSNTTGQFNTGVGAGALALSNTDNVAQQQKGMEVLTAQLKEQAAQIQKVSAQLEMSNSAAKVAVNKP